MKNLKKLSYKEKKDGPAVEWLNGDKECFINGKHYTFKEWLEFTTLSYEEKILLKLKYS